MTDSSGDSDCFESADEGFDDEVVAPRQRDAQTRDPIRVDSGRNEESSRRSKDVGEKVPDENDPPRSALQYRKRPERGKLEGAEGDTIASKSNRKTSLNDQIFSTDMMKPGKSLIQGIANLNLTSNISKNLNKGIHTIQQTSSSIKDLVFSSLPVTSQPELIRKFSYDDDDDYLYDHYQVDLDDVSSDINKESVQDTPFVAHEEEEVAVKETDAVKLKDFLVESEEKDVHHVEGEEEEEEEEGKKEKDGDKLDKMEKSDVEGEKENLGEREEEREEENEDGEARVNIIEEKHERVEEEEEEKLDRVEEEEKHARVEEEEEEEMQARVEKEGEEMQARIEEEEEEKHDIIKDLSNQVADDLDFSNTDTEKIDKKIDDEIEVRGAVNDAKDAYGKFSGDANINETSEFEPEAKNLNLQMKSSKDLIANDSVNGSLHFMGDITNEEEVINAKDGWDSTELELDEFEIECESAEPSLVPVKNNSEGENEESVKSEHKAVENSDLDNNEGWDDFDFDDDAINEVVGSESQGSTITRSKEGFERGRSEPEEDKLSSKPSEEFEWSGWDNFGEKQEAKPKTGWNLGGWGVNALLSTATSVTQGISNVLEAGLGAPDPEELARREMQSSRRASQSDVDETSRSSSDRAVTREDSINLFPDFGITNLVAGVTNKIVEHTKVGEIGSRVISGGLDTLENLGKKTMEVLQEGDPGLMKKRSMLLGPDKPILSQVLREAKTRAEIADRQLEKKQMARFCHFETLFDDFQGLVHLEALEMLSKQCELKLEQMKDSLSTKEAEELIGTIEEVKELCVIDEDEFEADYSTMVDFRISLERAVEPLKNQICIEKIIHIHEGLEDWLKSGDSTRGTPVAAFQKAISTLAELTAATVQQYHKGGELLSIKEHRKTVEEADTLLRMTGVLCSEVNQICEKFLKVQKSLEREGNEAESNERASRIMKEAANAISYIKEGFNLLIPVLQLGAAG